jgi:release factor glutamine methyltransferase
LITQSERRLTEQETQRLSHAFARRMQGEPIAYIVGRREFYGLSFDVTPDVLIPRPETEILVEEAIHELRKLDSLTFCEIGIGSGCISVSILHNVPNATAFAADISEKALAVARRNAKRHGVADRLVSKQGDLFAGIIRKFDMIVSNPPYISDGDLADMQLEVRDFEPHNALFAGIDGLDIVRRIIDDAPKHLNGGGLLLMEIGFGQMEILRGHFDRSIWSEIAFLSDLQGIPRIVRASLAIS